MSEFIAPSISSAELEDSINLLLTGRRAWIISDGVAGHLAITQGIANVLGLKAEVKGVNPGFPWRHLAPFGPADPGELKSLLAKPLPDIVLGAGRQTVPFVRALKRAGGFTVLFQSPRASLSSAHVVWAPTHDGLQGSNVISTLTPPHRFTLQTLDALRREVPQAIASLPSPKVALLIGGPGAGYRYSPHTIRIFGELVREVAAIAGSLLISPSRRTPADLLAVIDEETHEVPRILLRSDGPNLYPYFLASADFFIVTADSVNMTGEACATGKPVFVFSPPGGRGKFRRFHAALQAHGATRPLPEPMQSLARWSYEPLASAEQVAAEIQARWQNFRSTTPRP